MLLAATLIAFTLATPAMAFDIGTIDGLPADMKDIIAKQSGGRITNGQSRQQAGQEGQPQQGRQARKKQSAQDKAMQKADEVMKGDSSIGRRSATSADPEGWRDIAQARGADCAPARMSDIDASTICRGFVSRSGHG
jgi:hypothetical protein